MWTTFIAAAVTAVLFTGLSIAVFGVAVVPAFLHGMSGASSDLSNGVLPWQQMASPFAGTFVISPYIYNYDAVWLGIPVALLTAKGLRDGWLRWERPILILTFLYPLFGNELAYAWNIGLGPLVFAALLFVSVRRVAHHRPALARFDPKVHSRLAE